MLGFRWFRFVQAVIVWCLGAGIALGQSLNFQGRLTDPVGTPLDGTVDVTLTLYDDSNAPVYQEAFLGAQIHDGLLNVVLGTTGDLSLVPFEKPLTLGIQVGTDSEMTPRLPVTDIVVSRRWRKAPRRAAPPCLRAAPF